MPVRSTHEPNYYSSSPGFQGTLTGGGGGGATALPVAHASPFSGPSNPIGPSSNPFSALFDPSRSGITGLIGRAMGNPTREEALAAELGQARSTGMSKLAQALQAGAPPQQAILEFVNTPEGMDFMMKDPDPMGTISSMIEMAQAPKAPDPINVSPGGTVVQPGADGSMTEVFRNATTEIQDFTGMAELGGLNEQELAEMARANLIASTSGDPTEKEAAAQRLVEAGVISPETADQWVAGMINVMPQKDQFGNNAGFVIVDAVKGTATPLKPAGTIPQPGDPDFADGITDGTTDDAVKAATPGTYLAELEDPADVVMGAGMISVFKGIGGDLLGQEFPDLAQTEIQSRRNGLKAIIFDAQNMRALLEDTGHSSTAEIKQIDGMLNKLSILKGPMNAAQSLIDWNRFLDTHQAKAQETMDNPKTSDLVRGNAAKMLTSIDRARANLPTIPQLEKKMEEIRSQSGGVSEGVSDMLGMGEDALEREGVLTKEEDKPDVPAKSGSKSYKTAKEALDGYKNGEYQIGDTITIGGKQMKVAPDGE